MNTGDRELALRIAVGDWQKRHGLSDRDPLLGVVELFELFLRSLDKEAGFPSQKMWEELSEAVELLSQRVKALSKQIEGLGCGTPTPHESESNGGLVFLAGAVLFGAGMALGRFFG